MNRSRGYTLIELLLAMAIMTFAFLILTAGILDLYRRYESGLAIRNTQQNARLIANQIIADGRDSALVVAQNLPVNGWSSTDAICFFSGPLNVATSDGYVYYVRDAGGGINQLVRRPFSSQAPTACDPAFPMPAGQNEQVLSADNVSVIQLHSTGTDPKLAQITLSMASTFDLLDVDPSTLLCRGAPGGQFCSVTSLPIAVMSRKQ